jgi:iron complex transport system permease protein
MSEVSAASAAFQSARRFTPGRAAAVYSLLVVILGAVASASVLIGSSDVGPSDLWALAMGRATPQAEVILTGVRLPRVLLAVAVGAALAAAGAALQSILRNPLADPYILGVSGGAGLGAILWSSLGAGSVVATAAVRPFSAFTGSLLAVLMLLVLARLRGRRSPETMLLMGSVINATCIALILFVISIADISRYQGVMYWLVGNLSAPPPSVLGVVGAAVAAGILLLTIFGGQLNLLSVGEETAEQLGASVGRVRLVTIVAACLVTAAAVSVSGLIGFVGLMVPHMARIWFGPDNRILIPASALLGGAILTVADTAARTIVAPTQLPVGVITALAGGPFFLWLFARRDPSAGGWR